MTTVLVQPIGGQDVRLREEGMRGPFPDPGEFSSTRRDQLKVDAREWGAACLKAVAGLPREEQARLVAAHLDAPFLRRVLEEAPLPKEVKRLVFVVTDQATEDRRGHWDDTASFGELLSLWLEGSAAVLPRRVKRVDEPIVLRDRPDELRPVMERVSREVERVLDGCDEAVVVQGGGTPAMKFGVLLTIVLGSAGKRVRHVHVPDQRGIVEAELPAVIHQARTVEVARRLLDRRQPGAAAALLDSLGEAEPIRQSRQVCVLADRLHRSREIKDKMIGAAETALSEKRTAELRALASQPRLTVAIKLGGWDAQAAWRQQDFPRYVNLVSAVFDHLPAHWFLAAEGAGIQPDDAAGVMALFPTFDDARWRRFIFCRRPKSPPVRDWSEVKVEKLYGDERTRAKLVHPRHREFSDQAMAAVFDCLTSDACRCKLGEVQMALPAAMLPGLQKALDAWRRFQESELHRLRNRSILSHEVLPTPPGRVRAAVQELGRADGDGAAWLAEQLKAFCIDLGDDLVEQLCADAAQQLGKL
jgi:hypothetical protein